MQEQEEGQDGQNLDGGAAGSAAAAVHGNEALAQCLRPENTGGEARASLNATKHLMYSRHNFRRTLARILALAKQEQEALEAMRSWLPDAITLKLKNPELYAELEKIADQNSNEL